MLIPSFGVSRTFDTTLERLWRAFTDGAELASWASPADAKALRSEVNLAIDGTCRFDVRTAQGVAVRCAWRVTRLEPPALVAFHHQFTDEGGRPVPNPLDQDWPPRLKGEIRCALQGGGATATINLAPLEPTEAQAAAFRLSFSAMSEGWERALDRLERCLAAG
jgi:uncharacterized protein YndB with AHSA1/START domain